METEPKTPETARSAARAKLHHFLRPNLPVALGGAICIALLLTVISTFLYVTTGTITTDLSRPGYERIRQEVRSSNQEKAIYDTTSPVTAKALDNFLVELTRQTQELNSYNNFTSNALDDTELQLTSAEGSSTAGQ